MVWTKKSKADIFFFTKIDGGRIRASCSRRPELFRFYTKDDSQFGWKTVQGCKRKRFLNIDMQTVEKDKLGPIQNF